MDHSPPPDSDAEDRALIARIARGDSGALEQLYRRHSPWLLRRLDRRAGDADLADLALQDTFIAVWRSAKKFRGDGAVAAWIWGIAVRRLIDHLRKHKIDTISVDDVHPAAVAVDPDLLELVGGGVARDRIGEAVARLEPELRTVLVVTAVDGLSTKEAADLLGVPRGTVKTRLMRARQRVREDLS